MLRFYRPDKELLVDGTSLLRMHDVNVAMLVASDGALSVVATEAVSDDLGPAPSPKARGSWTLDLPGRG